MIVRMSNTLILLFIRYIVFDFIFNILVIHIVLLYSLEKNILIILYHCNFPIQQNFEYKKFLFSELYKLIRHLCCSFKCK